MRGRSARPSTAPSHGRLALLSVVAVVATALGAATAATPAQAAGTEHPRVLTVAASADWLVYRQKTTTAYGLSFPRGARLYAIGLHGARHALPGFDPERTLTLQGSVLVQADEPSTASDPALPEEVRWRDLATGRSGVHELPAGEDLVGAAPGGWVTARTETGAEQVVRYRTSGSTSLLGAPVASTAPVQLRVGPTGVIAAAQNSGAGRFDEQPDGSGVIRWVAFRSPGTWRTVLRAGRGVSTSCRVPSGTHAVCEVDGVTTGKHSGTVLLALAGHRRAWLDDHPRACPVTTFETVGASAVGKASSTQDHCVRGRLTQLRIDGRVTTPTRSWGAHASHVAAGLGGILLDTADQRRIVRLPSVGGAPRTIVTAH